MSDEPNAGADSDHGDENEDLVPVAAFGTVMEAELAKNRLEAIGIAAFVSGDLAVGVMPFLGSGGSVGVMVTKANEEEARAFLATPTDADANA